MSGSYILGLFGGGGGGAGSDLIATLYGGGGGAGQSSGPAYGVTTSDPIIALQEAQATQTQGIAYEAKQPTVERTLQSFTAAVAHAKSVQQLLSNPDVLDVLLTANGLGDQTGFPALAQKALTSDLSDPHSLANQLTNTNWKAAAQTYQFAAKGLSVIKQPKVLSTLASAYAEVQWRQSLDRAVPGLSNALTFKQGAGTITSVDQILGNSAFRTVVTTALGIPEQIAFQPLEAQERAISSRLDIRQFKNPGFVNAFTQRYLLAVGDSTVASSGASLTSGLIV